MEIKKVKEGFVLLVDGFEAGVCDLSKESDTIYSITHVIVDPRFRGHGYASMLVKAAANWAKENNVHLIPICSFSHSEFEKNKEYQALLPKSKFKIFE